MATLCPRAQTQYSRARMLTNIQNMVIKTCLEELMQLRLTISRRRLLGEISPDRRLRHKIICRIVAAIAPERCKRLRPVKARAHPGMGSRPTAPEVPPGSFRQPPGRVSLPSQSARLHIRAQRFARPVCPRRYSQGMPFQNQSSWPVLPSARRPCGQ